MFDVPRLLVLAAVAIVGSLGFSPGVADAGHDPVVATFAVDVGIADNIYNADPNSDGVPSDNRLVVGAVDSCVEVASTGAHAIDMVGKNMQDATFYDIRLLYNPAHVAIITGSVRHTPFADNLGAPVGLINLPFDASTLTRPGAAPANNIDNVSGNAFLSATYLGSRTAFFSPDQPHPPSATEPYTAGPGGVPLVRLSVSLKPAAAGKVVTFDLTNSVMPGNDYGSFDPGPGGVPLVRLSVSLKPAAAGKVVTFDLTNSVMPGNDYGSFDGTQDHPVPVPDSNLIDGAIAVAPATCPPGATTAPSEPTTTPSMTSPVPAPAQTTPGQTGSRTPADGGVGGEALTEEQLEELTEATIEGLMEEAKAGQTGLDAVLDTVTAGGSTDVLALCADENANPRPDVDITFKIDQQPGSDSKLDGQAEVTKTSDAEGVAEATLDVGNTSGKIVVSATAEECNTASITVTVEAADGPGTGERATAGDDDSGSGATGWQVGLYAGVGAVVLAAGAGLIWRRRRHSG